MYKGASQGAQAAHDTVTRRLEVAGADDGKPMSGLERLRNLQHALHQRQTEMESFPKKSPERKRLALAMAPLQVECGLLRKQVELLSKNELGDMQYAVAREFIDLVRDQLQPAVFKLLMSKAIETVKARQADAGSEQ